MVAIKLEHGRGGGGKSSDEGICAVRGYNGVFQRAQNGDTAGYTGGIINGAPGIQGHEPRHKGYIVAGYLGNTVEGADEDERIGLNGGGHLRGNATS